MTSTPAPRLRVRRTETPSAQANDETGAVAARPLTNGHAGLTTSSQVQHLQSTAPAPVEIDSSVHFRLHVDHVSAASLISGNRKLRRAGKRLQEKMQRNVRRFGIVRPILVRRRDGTVIAGHSILEAAIALGMTEIPVVYIDHLSDDEIRALRISLHRIEELSSWDEDALKLELEYLVEVDPDLLVFTGFDTAEIDVRLDDPKVKADAADDVPKIEGPVVSRRGDIWLFKGGHRLICGDAMSVAVFVALMESEQARLVISDTPFNVRIAGHVSGRKGAREFAMASGEMTPAEFTRFLKTAFENAARVSMDGSLALYFIDWRHIEEMMAAGRDVYAGLKNVIVWSKTNAGMGSLWRSQHELIFAWKLGSAPHINNVELGKHGRWRSNVWNYAGANAFGRTRDEDLDGHVTPKSVAMLHDAILDVTNRADIVLDPFAGAGSTLVAAHRARRVGYGIEIDPIYVDTAVRRLEKFTKAPARHAETGKTFDEMMSERQAAPAPSA